MTQFYDPFTDFNRNLAKPLAQFNALATRATETLTKQNINTANELLNLNVKHVQSLANVRKLEDMISLQTTYLNEASNKCVSYVNDLFDSALKMSADWSKMFEEGVKTASEETARVVKSKV